MRVGREDGELVAARRDERPAATRRAGDTARRWRGPQSTIDFASEAHGGRLVPNGAV